MTKKRDLSDILKEKAAERSEAMAATKARIENAAVTEPEQDEPALAPTSGTTERRGPGRPQVDPTDPRKAVTINLKASLHKKLKMYAVMHDTTVSALVEAWIEEHCSEA